jgi:hypothetical protein
MIYSFGEQIKQFALSVDLVSEPLISSFRTIICAYFKEKLCIDFIEHMIDYRIDDSKVGLVTYWDNLGLSNGKHVYSIKNEDGTFKGQTSFAFEIGRPMWIVNSDNSCLEMKNEYIDLWSGVKNIPEYWHYNSKFNIKTSIIYPYRGRDGNVSILNLESSQYLNISNHAKGDIGLVAEALEILYKLENTNKSLYNNSYQAIENIKRVISSYPKLVAGYKPGVFLASSSRANEDVMGAIRETVDKFENKIEALYWKDISEAGNINSQILSAINMSTYGICYFSEKSTLNEEYIDNPNVIFEAGMLQSLTNEPTSKPMGWIPIRENSPNIPFDFARERILIVPRLNDGSLNLEKFNFELKKRIESLLNYNK